MDAAYPSWTSLPAARRAAVEGRYGVLLRLARTAAGLTLDDAGRRVGYSAATLSRIENGRQPLTDVNVLRRLATAFAIPAGLFGLAEPGTEPGAPRDAPAVDAPPGPALRPAPAVHHDARPLGGDGARAGTDWSPLTAAPVPERDEAPVGTLAILENVLFETAPAEREPATVSVLRSRLAAANADYRSCRYHQLGRRLPRLLRATTTMYQQPAPEYRLAGARLMAEAYNLATLLLIKMHEDGLAWITNDRARQAAAQGGDVLLSAETARLTAIMCRRSGRYRRAVQLLRAAAERVAEATALGTPASAVAYARLLATAAYAAATGEDRGTACELLEQASDAIGRSGLPAPLGATDITLYRISVLRALGDYGSAIDCARTLDPETITTPERRVRYWHEVAVALYARGRYQDSYRALLAAERVAPQELIVGRWAQRLSHDLARRCEPAERRAAGRLPAA